jgi:hypothetical protein
MPWWKIQEIMSHDGGSGVDSDCLHALERWQDHHQLESRVEAQLEAVDRPTLGPKKPPTGGFVAILFRLGKVWRLPSLWRTRRWRPAVDKGAQPCPGRVDPKD